MVNEKGLCHGIAPLPSSTGLKYRSLDSSAATGTLIFPSKAGASPQGLALLYFSEQPEPFLAQNTPQTPNDTP